MNKKYIINIVIISQSIFSQDLLSTNFTKSIFHSFYGSHYFNNSKKSKPFNLLFLQSAYINTNLPNFENNNGYLIEKGYGFYQSINFKYSSDYASLHIGPTINIKKKYDLDVPDKFKSFSALNDVNVLKKNKHIFKNTGLKIYGLGLSLGYGNWNRWIGPGIHNSLIFSNNSEGFYHYYLSTRGYKKLSKNLLFKFDFILSDKIKNLYNINYFISIFHFNFKYKNLQLGLSRHITSGGYRDIKWSLTDASLVQFTHRNIRYWDIINHYYFIITDPINSLKIFIEIGFPGQNYLEKDFNTNWDNGIGSNIGFQKLGIFDIKNMIFGFEYTRLLQGSSYNTSPSSIWYDNIKYDYSSYNGRRWAAHSGSDSDDLLIFTGYLDLFKSLIIGINYERHGVTYRFPPEVKLEHRLSAHYKFDKLTFFLEFENEFYEHYGFTDINRNVWDQTFEPGSLQNTKTLLFTIEYLL